tara:strand:- start:47 stop:1054 length:1008 start_codon:yes stop_codon:yes gene_type:complete
MKTRKQLRDSLRNLYEIIDNYENDFRPDFLQGEYSHWIADYDDPKSMDYWKKDGEFCVVGWLAVNKEIELPHYIHDLKKTGYVFKGKVMQNKYEYRDEGNVKVGEEEYQYDVEERACECELHTQQEDEDRDNWVDEDYVDYGIQYADLKRDIVPETDNEIMGDEYKEYFLNASVDLDTLSSRSYTDTQRFVMDLIKAYNLPHVLIEHLQMINDSPSFNMLHSILGNCGHGYKLDERYAVDKELHGTKIAKCSNENMNWSLDLGGWKKPIVDYLRTSLRPDNPVLDEMMDCDYNFQYLSNEMLKAFIKLLLTKDRFADYYISDNLKSETDYMVERI